jgi:hypothetical protein
MDDVLRTLRSFDTRKYLKEDELREIAKRYNVKARIWERGIVLRDIDKKIYQRIRDQAVENLLWHSGGTIEQLCAEIERLIDEGSCGLGQKTYLPATRRREPMPATVRQFAGMVRRGRNGR